MKTNLFFITSLTLLISVSCNSNKNEADAYGNFEAEEIMVPAEVTGKLLTFDVTEGMLFKKNQTIGTIDDIQLKLKKER